MDAAEASRMLAEVPGWRIERGRLVRELAFADFRAAMAFLRQVEDVAEGEGHHPDVHLERYRHVRIELWTHAAGGLTPNDFVLADRVGRLAAAPAPPPRHEGDGPAPAESRILVRDLEAWCVIGTQPKERAAAQRVLIQLDIGLRPAGATRAAASDDIADTLDYKRLKDRLLREVAATRYNLLEALARHVAAVALDDPAAAEVDVTVDKPGALTGSRSVAVRSRFTRAGPAGPAGARGPAARHAAEA